VSPSSPDCLRLHLAQQGWRLDGAGQVLSAEWPDAQRADALENLSLPAAGKTLQVTLEQAWARCQLVRFPPQVRAPAERQAFLQAMFRDTQGIAPQAWQIITEPALAGEPVLAAAIELRTLAALQKLAQKHRLRLTHIQPAFSTVWNRLHAHMGVANGALAWFADARVSLGLWQAGSWHAWRSQAQAAGDSAGFETLLEWLLASSGYSAEAGVLYLAGLAGTPQITPPQGWSCTRLSLNTDREAT